MRRAFITVVLTSLFALPLFAGKPSYQYFAVGNQNDVTFSRIPACPCTK